ncbi:MAG: efflux RND transporter permease subunit [Candidatus Omnitrophica bacterium]|nr:efflux RND transporter permease subunit [Candidatus Omnitrophota bacterium]
MDHKEGWIEKLIGFSAQNKMLILICVAFSLVAAIWSIQHIPLDAIPDLSDTQVIIYSRWDRSPDIMEDQVTYPIVSALLGAPGVKAVRGFSDFGFSYVYVIFNDGVDIYWARSRVLEYLNKIIARLPQGVKTELGPDATGVGWVFQYVLVDKTGKHDLQQLRSYQDWYLRYYLQSVPGVAEVASLGGFVKQYQITVDPNKLLAYRIPIPRLVDAVKDANEESSGGLVDFGGAEYMVRGHGYVKSIKDLENTVVGNGPDGAPILMKNVAQVGIGPELRRGVSDLNGQGDVVGGTVVMRYGENALNVINRVKAKLKEIRPSLPPGVEIKVTYDRSDLILRAIENLRHQLTEEMIIVSLVILLFLWHFPSAFIPIITIPVAVVLAFIPMLGMKLTSNIMSLAGIAISIGVLVDGAIVQMENVYKHLEYWEAGGRKEDYRQVCIKALKEVGPAVFFSLLVIAVSFLPIFTLVDQEGRLFKPLAWSKTFAMAIAAVLVVTLNPALRMLLLWVKPFRSKIANALLVGRYYPEEKHPVSRVLFRIYDPICRFVLRYPKQVIAAAVVLMLVTIPVYMKLGSEFMPPLWEGSILYMPITMPGISAPEALKLLQTQDKLLKSFPEVTRVWGKAGRMASSTDPAPLSMMETVVLLKPENQWPRIRRWYSALPPLLQAPFKVFWPDHISHRQLIDQMDRKLQIPGTTNAWTMPIKNRIDMLSTGVRTPIGIKVLGPDINEIQRLGLRLEGIIKNIPGTRSVYAERTAGGYFLDFDLKRDQLARYGLSVRDAQMTIESAVGGEDVTETVEGRERYSVNVRYPSELRESVDQLKRVLIATPSGAQIPIGQVADIVLRSGPSMIRDENGMLAGYVYVDVAGRDIGSYVAQAKKAVDEQLQLPQGYSLLWSGQYENMLRVRERLKVVLPLTLFIIAFLLYMNTKSMVQTGIVLLSVPFSLIGAVWLLWAIGFNVSIAVWVGMIALMGLDAETGVLLLLFMELAYKEAIRQNRMHNLKDLQDAIVQGSVRRLRPKMMTVAAAFVGLLPIMWSNGAGADVMKRIAAPMVGGLITSFLLGLLVYPAVYYIWKAHFELKGKLK